MKTKHLLLSLVFVGFASASMAQDTIYINANSRVNRTVEALNYENFSKRINIFIGAGLASGIGASSDYRFSEFEHESELGPTFDVGASYQFGFGNGFHLETSAMFSYHDFYEDQSFHNPKENKSYLINGNTEYYGGRLTFTFGKEFQLNQNWIYSFSVGPIFDILGQYSYARYTVIDHNDPAASQFNQSVSWYDTEVYESGFRDFVKLSMQNKFYLVGKRRGGGLFLNIQTLYLGKAKFGAPFDHPGFYGISNTAHVGYTFRF